jgi:membrane peptidoglycan carboxypeptidase
MVAAVIASGVWLFTSVRTGLPDKDAMGRMGTMAEATLIYDAQDKLAFTIFNEQRIDVALAEMSPNLIRAIIAVEDQRFYSHHGFDLIRIASAALTNVRRGRAAQGGSTITQQLARQSFLTTDKTIRRKLQELILAERIECVPESPDPRALPEQSLFRRRPVRRRSSSRGISESTPRSCRYPKLRCSPGW